MFDVSQARLRRLDASRSIDQGYRSRTLGRIANDESERIAAVVIRHSPDTSIADGRANRSPDLSCTP